MAILHSQMFGAECVVRFYCYRFGFIRFYYVALNLSHYELYYSSLFWLSQFFPRLDCWLFQLDKRTGNPPIK